QRRRAQPQRGGGELSLQRRRQRVRFRQGRIFRARERGRPRRAGRQVLGPAMLHLRAAFLGALALLVFAWPAGAAEVINAFAADIVLRADRSVLVTETIDVTAEGREIRRGIYRDIPT